MAHQPFRFPDLPLDIRRMIYPALFSSFEPAWIFSKVYSPQEIREALLGPERLNEPVRSVRKMKIEADPEVCKILRKDVKIADIKVAGALMIQASFPTKHMTKLTIMFWGISLQTIKPAKLDRFFEALMLAKNLKVFTIHFQHLDKPYFLEDFDHHGLQRIADFVKDKHFDFQWSHGLYEDPNLVLDTDDDRFETLQKLFGEHLRIETPPADELAHPSHLG